jgi:hypothetical protein
MHTFFNSFSFQDVKVLIKEFEHSLSLPLIKNRKCAIFLDGIERLDPSFNARIVSTWLQKKLHENCKVIISCLDNPIYDVFIHVKVSNGKCFCLCLNFFHLLARKSNLEKCLFIQTNSFIIFICPNSVLLVPGFGQVG